VFDVFHYILDIFVIFNCSIDLWFRREEVSRGVQRTLKRMGCLIKCQWIKRGKRPLKTIFALFLERFLEAIHFKGKRAK
jgi:hypothetical protein